MPRRKPLQLPPSSYWRRSSRPLHSLFFLVPLLVFYELGTLVCATDYQHGVTQHIYARTLLHWVVLRIGFTGYFMPGAIVAAVLLGWHVATRFRKAKDGQPRPPGDPWEFEPRVYGWMAVESLLLSLPLFLFMAFLGPRHPAQMALAPGPACGPIPGLGSALLAAAQGDGAALGHSWQAQLVFSIGAGIYEELLFRLIGIAFLHLLLVDILGLPEDAGAVGAILLTAIAFAFYHFDAHTNPFTVPLFVAYSVAGVYFAAIYVWRGFGLVAGTHAMYDVLVVVSRALLG